MEDNENNEDGERKNSYNTRPEDDTEKKSDAAPEISEFDVDATQEISEFNVEKNRNSEMKISSTHSPSVSKEIAPDSQNHLHYADNKTEMATPQHELEVKSDIVDDDESIGKPSRKKSEETIVYEWEEELEEYDEPDIYPSEKDYKWFEEQVTDEEEEPETEQQLPGQSEEQVDAPEAVTVDESTKEEVTKESEPTEPAKVSEGSQEGEEEEDQFLSTLGQESEEPPEEEGDLSSKKKYKTIMVRRLVERPPKIYHVAANIRVKETSNSMEEFPQTTFRFLHSFGYDCQRLGNLIVLDSSTLLFMSGFVLTFYNHITFARSYLRTLGGYSFGSIALHPSRKLFAAAEKGHKPVIGIWSWPKLQLFRMLKEGTDNMYSSVHFSPDGTLLASQGGEPDFLITVWNWLTEAPILRVKSHVQDVYRVTFAKELVGLLTTSGLCHIKFWKMAETFTGLKLKGDVGRFGRTELSDIEGYVEMSDGKVLSGTEWGSLLVWENGLVIAELCLQNTLPCHAGVVRQILLVEGDFYTTGQDGRIKVWRYEDVDTAEIHTTMNSLKVPIKAVTDVTINEEGDIWSIFQDPYNNDDVSVFWFAQDGKGHIWLTDLSFLNIAKEPKIVLTAHGGPIVDSVVSLSGRMLATLGEDGRIIVHDYISRQIIALRGFSAPGSCLIWPNLSENNYGQPLIAGFCDGVIRVLKLSKMTASNGFPISITLQNVYKPHKSKVTSIALTVDGHILVTGSLDGTIFFFNVTEDFKPMFFIEMPDLLSITKVFWSKFTLEQRIVIVICVGSYIQEVEMSTMSTDIGDTTFCLKNPTFLRNCSVQSIKSVLRHNEELKRKQMEEEERQVVIEAENQRLLEEEIETQVEQDARLLEEALELERARALEPKEQKKWEPYIPPIPSRILEAFHDHLDSDVIHITLDGYDSGYIYSIRLLNDDLKSIMKREADKPFNAVPVINCDDVPINKLIFINGGLTALMGFQDGRVRMSRLMYRYELESIRSNWTMGLHDVVRGNITSLSVDAEGSFLFTTGMDGNCFMHTFLDDEALHNLENSQLPEEIPVVKSPINVHDITSPEAYTLEDSKSVQKERAIIAAARRNKAAKREKITQLRFRFAEILSRNNEIPPEIRLTPVELNIFSDSVTRSKERYELALEELKKEMAWNCEYVRLQLEKVKSYYVDRVQDSWFVLKAFKSAALVSSFRIANFPDFFDEAKEKAIKGDTFKISLFDYTERDTCDTPPVSFYSEQRPKRKPGMDKFVHQKLVRLWERRQQKLRRKKEWDEFLKTDPSEQELEGDVDLINHARLEMGDMKLKIDPNYKVPENRKLTVTRARQTLVSLEEKMFGFQKNFNRELFSLRNHKIKILERLNKLRDNIKTCQSDLPESKHLTIPTIPEMTAEEDPQGFCNFTKEDVLLFQQKRIVKATAQISQPPSGTKKAEPVKRRKKSFGVGKFEIEEEKNTPSNVEIVQCTPSRLELEIEIIQTAKAEFYQMYYIKCIERDQFQFDARLKLMVHEKIQLDYDLKIAEAKMITLTEEFILAQKSVTMEMNLEHIVKESTKEKRVCTSTMKTLQKSIDSYKTQIESVQVKRNALLKEVQEIATNAPHYEKYLIRVFRKKITASKRKRGSNDDDDDDASEDSDDSNESDDIDMGDEEDDEDDLDVDLRPSDLKADIYDAVIKVRNRRLDLDAAEIKAKSSMEELMSQTNGFRMRMNVADQTLQRTKQELDKFNLEKQNKLNSMELAVSLTKRQLHYMHTELGEAMVINKKDIKRLRERIPELQKERSEEKKRVHTTKYKYRRRLRDDKAFKQKIEQMGNQCDKEMLRKFGKVKPIEELEYFQEDPEITKMKKDMQENQINTSKIISDLEKEMYVQLKNRAAAATEQKDRFNVLVEMQHELVAVSSVMEAGLSSMPQRVDQRPYTKDIIKMKELVRYQSHVIQHLKQQIMGLISTSIQPLPPITPRQ